jgi:chemotaxis signal transduction protein
MTATNPLPQERSKQAELLLLRRGHIDFAVKVTALMEIKPVERIRKLPMSEEYLAGFVSFRGRIVPVLDPLALAGEAGAPVRYPVLVGMIEVGDQASYGLLVDSIGQMIPPSQTLQPAGALRIKAAFRGVFAIGAARAMWIDELGLHKAMGLAENNGDLPPRQSPTLKA